MSKRIKLYNRWKSILRHKAVEYEHRARKNGEKVTSPCLDDICNEIEAMLVGMEELDMAMNPPMMYHEGALVKSWRPEEVR